MNKSTFQGEKRTLPGRRIPNNSCLEEREQDSPSLRCGLCMLTSFQRAQQGMGEEGDFTVDTSDSHYLSQGTRVSSVRAKSDNGGTCPGYSVTRRAPHLWSPTYPSPQSNQKKNTRQIPPEGPSDQSSSKLTVIKNKKVLETASQPRGA